MNKLPITFCWHCDRPLDAATAVDEGQRPYPGAISLCLYCGAVGVFGDELRLEMPTKELLDALEDDKEFLLQYCQFAWARQFVMIKNNLMRDGDDPDR